MKLIEERIRKEGCVKSGEVLKVDAFLNHQIDMALVDQMEKNAIDPQNQTIFISHGDCEDDVQIVIDEIRKRFGTETFHINYVGPVIGSHTGAGVVALFFVGKER